ncbi:MAG TPA: hypothetical protein VGY96_17965, partial [Streptosporangiaceae bacterium]|nr:hypothetical protein [Streptosporangiaceae bacterium]
MTARIAAISAGDLDRCRTAALARPMPCSAEIVPPCSAASRSTASSTPSSSGAGPSTFTCRLPAPMCPKTIARASALAITSSSPARNAASRASGRATSSLCGMPAALIDSVCRSRYAHRPARAGASMATA